MHIKFDLKVFIFVLIFFISGNIKSYLLLMLFAILHECGHILAGFLCGLKVQSLEIMPVGIKVLFKIDMINYNKKIKKANLLALKKLIVAIAGPLVNLLFVMLFIILDKEYIVGVESDILIYVNVLIFLFNMLIIYPLDGGRILKNIIYIFKGKENSLRVTNIVSNVFAILVSIFTFYLSIISKNFIFILVLMYIWIIVVRENKVYSIKIKMYKILRNNIAINKD